MHVHDENIPSTLMQYRQSLFSILNAFAAVLPVQKVILFGSHCRGDAGKWSDVDLCVVASGISSQHQAAYILRKAIGRLRDKPPLTIIPISPERLEEKLKCRDPFYLTILHEGKTIATKN